jgi:hypothetical protein
MPGFGRHGFYFVGKVPIPFLMLFYLLLLNTFLMLFLPEATVGALRWYHDNSNAIQSVLLALMAGVAIIFRKRIHWHGRK